MKRLQKKDVFIAIMFIYSLFFVSAAFGSDVTVNTNTTWQAGTYTYDNVLITNSATLTFNGAVTLNAQNLTIDATSSISANETGYKGGACGNIPGEGPGGGKIMWGYFAGGGGYGGRGGGQCPFGPIFLGGASYGSAIAPVDLGSGGGGTTDPQWGFQHKGGSGGGAIKLVVSDTLILNGSITANGTSAGGVTLFASGGSGGSVYIITSSLTGAGTITANGGNGGGGGGRIAVYCKATSFSGSSEAKGGNSNPPAEDGTVVFIDTQNNILYSGRTFRFQENDTPFNFNTIIIDNSTVTNEGSVTLSVDNLRIKNGSTFKLGSTSTININGNLELNTSAALTLDGSTNVKVGGLLKLDGTSFLSFTGGQFFVVPHITLNAGSTLTLAEENNLTTSDIVLTNSSVITHTPKGKIFLNVAKINLDATSSISANEKGYKGGARENTPGEGPGGGGSVSVYASGGGYGGKGADGIFGVLGGNTYGSATAPVDLGSGGGGSSDLQWGFIRKGGSGGGAIKLVVSDTLILNGSITANGENGASGNGGSGGSVYIITSVLTGSGLIKANGGNAGGGGRVTVYYKTTTFSGNAEAKGGGRGVANTFSENGTVVMNGLVSNFPVTFFNLIEKSSATSTLSESLLAQSVNLNNVSVSGNLNGTLNFTALEIIKITSGSFSGNGFSEGQFETTLEGVSYNGNWNGRVYFNPIDNKVYLKGGISGDLNGIAEGSLSESTPDSGVYDQYQAVWKLNRIGSNTTSVVINLTGVLFYQPPDSFNSQLELSQLDMEGSAWGYYTGPLSTVVTHLLITGENEYKNKGFSIISYNSALSHGEGWSYDQFVTSAAVEFQGLFKEPIEGKLSCILNESVSSKTLSGTIERLNVGLAPAPDLKIKIFGASRVSPGQTVSNIIEIRNDGLKEADDFDLISDLPVESEYVSNTGDGAYDLAGRNIIWDSEKFSPQSKKYFVVTDKINWGIGNNIKIGSSAYVQQKPTIDPSAKAEGRLTTIDPNCMTADIAVSNQNQIVDLKAEVSKQPAGAAPQEPDFWQSTTDSAVTFNGRFTYIPSTPEAVTVTFKLISPFTGEGSIADRISNALRRIDIAIDIMNTVLGSQKDIIAISRDQALYDFARAHNYLSDTSYEIFTGSNNARFAFRWTMTLLRNLPGGNVFGLPGNEIVDSIQSNLGVLKWKQFYTTSIAEQAQLVMAGKATDIKDPSDIKGEFFATRNGASYQASLITNARDPNELLVSPVGDVKPGDNLFYTINFENEGEGNAYGVYITDTLLDNLDDAALVVNNGGKYNSDMRTITWFIGELPSKQKGSVTFSVDVNNDAQDKAEVINFATVYFPSVPEITRTNGTVNRVITSIDNVAPTTVILAAPLANQAGWNNTDVTINLAVTDNDGGSGVKELYYKLTGTSSDEKTISGASAQVIISSEGTTNLSCYSVDNAGNTEASKSLVVKIDKTPPAITVNSAPQANTNGWNNSDVTVNFTATDNLSGVASVTEPAIVTNEGKEQHIGGEAVDLAGNHTSAFATLNIDKTPPVITTAVSPQPNSSGWNNTDVTISFAATDALSGVDSVTNPVTVTTEGADQLVSGQAIDLAGNKSTTPVTLNIDKTPPIITAQSSPQPNALGWNNSNVTVSFNADDSISGIKAVTQPIILTMEGDNHVVRGEAVDLADNKSIISTVIRIDKTPPQISVTANPNLLWPPNHKMVPVIIGGQATDTLSGIDKTVFDIKDEYGKFQSIISVFNSVIQLEAWRDGNDHDGRVYTVSVTTKDKAGNQTTSLTTIICPHDQGK